MTDHTNLIARLRLGASISRERKLNQGYDAVADEAADAIEALQAEVVADERNLEQLSDEVHQLRAEREVADAKEIQAELQEVITEMCNAIPDYDWSGGAAEKIKDAFARLTALESQEPVGEVKHMHELNDDWLGKLPIGTKLFLAAGAAPKEQT